MESLNEAESAATYQGKPFTPEKVRKLMRGTQSGVVLYSRHIHKSQGALIGITDEIYERWWNEDIHFFVYVDLDDETQTITKCWLQKKRITFDSPDGSQHTTLKPTIEDLEIFRNVMEFITT